MGKGRVQKGISKKSTITATQLIEDVNVLDDGVNGQKKMSGEGGRIPLEAEHSNAEKGSRTNGTTTRPPRNLQHFRLPEFRHDPVPKPRLPKRAGLSQKMPDQAIDSPSQEG